MKSIESRPIGNGLIHIHAKGKNNVLNITIRLPTDDSFKKLAETFSEKVLLDDAEITVGDTIFNYTYISGRITVIKDKTALSITNPTAPEIIREFLSDLFIEEDQ